MPYPANKHKTFSFSSDGSLNQNGLREIIQAISHKTLRPAIKYTLMIASEFATASSELCIFKSLQRIADESGSSKDTVRRHLKAITDMGLLRRQMVIDSDTQRQRPCLYTFTDQFVKIGIAFRRVADSVRSRKNELYQRALKEFNEQLDALLSGIEGSLSSDENPNKNTSGGLQTATGDGLQNTTQYNRSLDQTENNSGNIENQKNNSKIFSDFLSSFINRAVRDKKSACSNALQKIRLDEKNSKQADSKKKHTSPAKTDDVQSSFNHARYQAADLASEKAYQERLRAAASVTPEQRISHVQNLRAMLNQSIKKTASV